MAQRRKRRTKAEIEAEKAAKAAAAAETEKMESEGFEKIRHRDDKGHYVKDDPSTPENEAWDWVKKEEEEEKVEKEIELNFGSSYVKEIEEIIEQEDEAHLEEETPKPKVAKVKPTPVAKKNPDYDETTHSDIPLYGSARFRAKKGVKRGTH